jgi:predicted glycoside hydrolase/deacetylase ChbG (UPF0249 family)
MGAGALQQQAQQAGLLHSSWLTGVHYFAGDHADHEARMNMWLAQTIGHQGVVLMCHPGHDVGNTCDDIRAARSIEFGFLSSAAFEAMLTKHKLYPARGLPTLTAA